MIWIGGNILLKTILLFAVFGLSICDEYRIAWLAPTDPYDGIEASSTVGGLILALNSIETQGILQGDNFTVKWQETTCDRKGGIAAIHQVLVVDNFVPDIVIGPPCSEAMTHVGELAGYKDLPIFTWMADSSVFGDKTTYNSLVRSYGPVNEIADSLVQFLNYMTWTIVELISTTSYYSHGQGVYDAIMASSSITLARWQDAAADVETAANIKSYFDTLKKEARIVILALPLSELRTWMLAAYDNGMVDGDYVFIYLYNEIPSLEFKISVLETQFYNYGDERDPDGLVAYESLFVLTQNVEYVNQFTNFSSEANSSAVQSRLDELGISSLSAVLSDSAAPFMHDAMMLWAHLMNQSKDIGLTRDTVNGSFLLDLAKNQIFSGNYWATGDVYIDDNGDREPDFWILDLGEDKIFRVAMQTRHTILGNGLLTSAYEEVTDIIWGDGTKGFVNRPLTTPVCGFENENCPNMVPYIVLAVVVCVLVIAAIVAFFIIRKYQFEQGLKEMSWKMHKDDLKFTVDKKRHGSAFMRMSKANNSFGKMHESSIFSDGDAQSTMTNQGQAFIQTATYRKNIVAVKSVVKHKLRLDRKLLVEMRQMTDVKHPNLATFIGATTDTPQLHEVWQYCSKGSVYDILFNDSINLDTMFNFSIATDIFKGLKYLHKSTLKYHGNLKSSNCIVDSRWVCKLTDFGLRHFHSNQEISTDISDYKQYSRLYWTSPEVLRSMSKSMLEQPNGSQESDIYAGTIIVKEIFARNGPYCEYEDDMTPQEIISKVKSHHTENSSSRPFRPELKEMKTVSKAPPELLELIETGWTETVEERPSASSMLSKIKKINPSKSSNVMDNMVKMLESYSNNLEGLVQERAKQVEEEKKRSELLLYRMLPQSVAEALKNGQHVAPEAYDAVSIYFSDIVSFTSLAARSTPMQVVHLLNQLYTQFDAITNNHDVYKVETIGDAYMYVSGLPQRNDERHAAEVTACAMDILSCVLQFKVPHIEDYTLQIRIGIHTGPVVAGVVGLTMPRYCLFGDSVTVASLMESGGCPMRIHLSEKTFVYLSKCPGYNLAERGIMDVKGKKMKTYFVVSKEGYANTFPSFDDLAKHDEPKCRKLPPTTGKVVREGPLRPSAESGFYESENDTNSLISNANYVKGTTQHGENDQHLSNNYHISNTKNAVDGNRLDQIKVNRSKTDICSDENNTVADSDTNNLLNNLQNKKQLKTNQKIAWCNETDHGQENGKSVKSATESDVNSTEIKMKRLERPQTAGHL